MIDESVLAPAAPDAQVRPLLLRACTSAPARPPTRPSATTARTPARPRQPGLPASTGGTNKRARASPQVYPPALPTARLPTRPPAMHNL